MDAADRAAGALIEVLERARRAEKEQALTYRSLAARAEAAGEVDLAQRFHDLHADEQHHLSRLTARVLELRGNPDDLATVTFPKLSLEEWKDPVQKREAAEVERYTRILDSDLDPHTRTLITDILEVEQHHASELGGKWTLA